LDSNDAPINIDLSSQSIAENLSAGSFVAVLSSEDPDNNASYTYALVNGNGANGNATFTLRNDSLFTNAILNFEAQSVYTIRLRTLDQGGLQFEKVFSITVIDNNDAPVELHLSENTIAENLPAKSVIGFFTSVDPDAQNNFSYALVAGTGASDNASFSIVGNQLKTNQAFNFEVKNTYSIRVKSSDGKGGALESVFTIVVSDSNDAPSGINLTNNAIAENRQVGTLIGVFSTTDEDVNDIPSFSLFDGPNNNNNQFLLINNQLRTNAAFNFEDKDFYLIYVHAIDQNGIGIVRQFVINIIDSVDAPTAVLLSKSSIHENQPGQTFIGILNVEDPDQISNFKFALVGGAGSSNNAQFSISNDSLYTAAVFNFESKQLYQIRIKATDITQAFVEQSFSIAIEDAPDAPSAIVINLTKVPENAAKNLLIDTLSSIDEDQNDRFTYTLMNGAGVNDNASFKIIDNKLFTNASFDFETKNAYTVHVSSQDIFGLKVEKDILIQIEDMNEAPVIDTAIFSISELAKIGTIVGSCQAKDVDAGQTLTFSLVGTSPYFNVQSNGQVELKSELNYEKVKVIELTVKVEDMQTPSLSSTALITIHVTDEIEANIALPVSNIVTPNADGINDYFTIENVELYKDYTLSIFNANGLEVFKVLSQYDNSWKADYQGSTLPKGTYFYVFKNPKNGSEFKGSINVIN
jgi:gliding motility-associated-like protein